MNETIRSVVCPATDAFPRCTEASIAELSDGSLDPSRDKLHLRNHIETKVLCLPAAAPPME